MSAMMAAARVSPPSALIVVYAGTSWSANQSSCGNSWTGSWGDGLAMDVDLRGEVGVVEGGEEGVLNNDGDRRGR